MQKKQRKFNITPYGENFISQLTGIKFKIWRVTFLKSLLPLKNFGMVFRFSSNGRLTTCALRWDRVYISQLIRFARVSSHVVDFNARNKSLTAKLLQQGYRYHKLRKTFSKFYRRHYELVSKFNVGLKTLLHQGLSEPEFYGYLVYKFKKNCR